VEINEVTNTTGNTAYMTSSNQEKLIWSDMTSCVTRELDNGAINISLPFKGHH